MTAPDRRPVFHEKAFGRLQEAIAEVAAEVPELEGVGVVVLWRLADQSSVPSVLVQDATGGAFGNPDQLLRLHHATLTLCRYCLDRSIEGVAALRASASALAREMRAAHGQRTEPPRSGTHPPLAAPPPGPTPQPGAAADGDPDDHPA